MSEASQPLLSGHNRDNAHHSEQFNEIKRSLESALDYSPEGVGPGPDALVGGQAIMTIFTQLSRMNIALHDNHTLQQNEIDYLYRLMSQFNISANAKKSAYLSPHGINSFALKIKEASEGSSYDVNLLTLELNRANNEENKQVLIKSIITSINSSGEDSNLAMDRIFGSEKSVAAMMRLCKTIEELKNEMARGDEVGFNCSKCVAFYNRFPQLILHNGQPIDFTKVQSILSLPINTTRYTHDNLTSDIQT